MLAAARAVLEEYILKENKNINMNSIMMQGASKYEFPIIVSSLNNVAKLHTIYVSDGSCPSNVLIAL